MTFDAPSNLLRSFFGIVPSPLGDTLTLVVLVLGATLLPIDRIVLFFLFASNDRSIVIEAEGRPEVEKDFCLFKFKKLASCFYLNLTKDGHLGVLPSDLTEMRIEWRCLLALLL